MTMNKSQKTRKRDVSGVEPESGERILNREAFMRGLAISLRGARFLDKDPCARH